MKDDVASLPLTTAAGQVRTVGGLTTLFDLCLVAVDGLRPPQARTLQPVIDRIDATLSGADCTVGVLAVGIDATDAAVMLGPLAQRVALFADPDGAAAAALGVTASPALVWVTTEPAVRAAVAGWDGATWRPVLADLARKLAWTRPLMPAPGDPDPLPGRPFAIANSAPTTIAPGGAATGKEVPDVRTAA